MGKRPKGLPEPTESSRPPAGLLIRSAACLYDALCLCAVLFAATALALPLHGGHAYSPGNLGYTLYLVLVATVYIGWCWWRGGETLGMRAFGLRVLTADGRRLGFGQAWIRAVLAGFSWVMLGAGMWMILFDPGKRAWHDALTGTRVVRIRRQKHKA